MGVSIHAPARGATRRGTLGEARRLFEPAAAELAARRASAADLAAIEAALNASFTFTERQVRALAAHGRVLDAIRLRDTAGARTAMGRLLDLAAEDLHVRGKRSR